VDGRGSLIQSKKQIGLSLHSVPLLRQSSGGCDGSRER
jgi:hypothetical protein